MSDVLCLGGTLVLDQSPLPHVCIFLSCIYFKGQQILYIINAHTTFIPTFLEQIVFKEYQRWLVMSAHLQHEAS